jgi:hypothetical protein
VENKIQINYNYISETSLPHSLRCGWATPSLLFQPLDWVISLFPTVGLSIGIPSPLRCGPLPFLPFALPVHEGTKRNLSRRALQHQPTRDSIAAVTLLNRGALATTWSVTGFAAVPLCHQKKVRASLLQWDDSIPLPFSPMKCLNFNWWLNQRWWVNGGRFFHFSCTPHPMQCAPGSHDIALPVVIHWLYIYASESESEWAFMVSVRAHILPFACGHILLFPLCSLIALCFKVAPNYSPFVTVPLINVQLPSFLLPRSPLINFQLLQFRVTKVLYNIIVSLLPQPSFGCFSSPCMLHLEITIYSYPILFFQTFHRFIVSPIAVSTDSLCHCSTSLCMLWFQLKMHTCPYLLFEPLNGFHCCRLKSLIQT